MSAPWIFGRCRRKLPFSPLQLGHHLAKPALGPLLRRRRLQPREAFNRDFVAWLGMGAPLHTEAPLHHGLMPRACARLQAGVEGATQRAAPRAMQLQKTCPLV